MATLCLCLASLVSACTDDQEECTKDTDCNFGLTCQNNKCAILIPECDPNDPASSAECGVGKYCADNFTCQSGCRTISDCVSGQICDDNRCVTRPTCRTNAECGSGAYCNEINQCRPFAGQCRLVGEPCEPGEATAEGFVCTNYGDGPRCYNRCSARDVCAPAFNANTGDPIYRYSSESACPAGSACDDRGLGCRPSQCEGPVRGQATCDALFPQSGGSCVQVRNANGTYVANTFQCQPAGTIEDGQPCGAGAGGPLGGGACKAGRTCVNRIGLFNLGGQGPQPFCAKSCLNDLQCGVNERCVGDDEGTFGGAGICTERCDPFSVDVNQCSEGKKCFPISSEDGICTNLIPPGPKRPYDSCSDGGDAVCPSGTLCVSGQCLPQCDPTLPSQAERDATCPGGDPQSYVKILHLAQGAGKVDVVVDGVTLLDGFEFEALAQREGRDWFALAPGQHTIAVYADTDERRLSPALTATVNLTANQGYFVSAVPGAASGVAAVVAQAPRTSPAPGEMRASLSVVHNVQGAGKVDVVAVAANADVSEAANQALLAQDFDLGQISTFVEVNAGSYDVYVFPTGADRTTLNAAATFRNIMVPAGARVHAFAYGSVSALNPVTPGLKIVAHQGFTVTPRSGGYCHNLAPGNNQPTTPSWGICFQRCENGVQDYGAGACDGDGDPACQPFGADISVCFNNGKATGGQACGQVCTSVANGACAAQEEVECADGFFCDETGAANPAGTLGAGTGTCRSYCTTEGVTNPNLQGCDAAAGERCMPSALINGLGQCRLPCQPDAPGSFKSNSCPANQQNCRPDDRNVFCHASGDIAIGQQCAGASASLRQSCVPGAMCVRNVRHPETGLTAYINAFLSTADGESATCRKMCRPFIGGGQSDCPADFGCMPIMPTQDINRDVGVCMPKATINDRDECDGIGKMCGDGAFCTENNRTYDAVAGVCRQTGTCLRLCDPVTKLGCQTGQRCREQGSVDARVFVFGVFGICQDLS